MALPHQKCRYLSLSLHFIRRPPTLLSKGAGCGVGGMATTRGRSSWGGGGQPDPDCGSPRTESLCLPYLSRQWVYSVCPTCLDNGCSVCPSCLDNVCSVCPTCLDNWCSVFPTCLDNECSVCPTCLDNGCSVCPTCLDNWCSVCLSCLDNECSVCPTCLDN